LPLYMGSMNFIFFFPLLMFASLQPPSLPTHCPQRRPPSLGTPRPASPPLLSSSGPTPPPPEPVAPSSPWALEPSSPCLPGDVLQFSCNTTSLNSGVRSSNSDMDGRRWLRWALHA
jgi:hypothetical protein